MRCVRHNASRMAHGRRGTRLWAGSYLATRVAPPAAEQKPPDCAYNTQHTTRSTQTENQDVGTFELRDFGTSRACGRLRESGVLWASATRGGEGGIEGGGEEGGGDAGGDEGSGEGSSGVGVCEGKGGGERGGERGGNRQRGRPR